MAVVTVRQLLESGVHFGHQTRRWNPKMKRYILTERNGIYIIDLKRSLSEIDRAYEFVKETVAHGGSILFIGTKKQAQEAVAEQAQRVGMPYVNHRWLGGMLTNMATIRQSIERLRWLDNIEKQPEFKAMSKKELAALNREREKLLRNLRGIREMDGLPDALVVVDSARESIAVAEARRLSIPIVAVVDTNADPALVDFPIPANDDSIRSIRIILQQLVDAIVVGSRG